MKKEEIIMNLFNKTIDNCKLYEKENKEGELLNEIELLRGIACVMINIFYMCPHTEDFNYFTKLQNDMKKRKLINELEYYNSLRKERDELIRKLGEHRFLLNNIMKQYEISEENLDILKEQARKEYNEWFEYKGD